MVVTDTNGEDVYVVLGLDQYEDLVGSGSVANVCECENCWDDYAGIDKQNDFSELKPTQSASVPADIWEAMKPAGETGETWNMDKMTDEEKVDLERQFEEYQKTKKSEGKTDEAEKPKENEEFDDLGEEQFYLEPVE